MVGVFFYCHNKSMDTVKLFDLLFEDEDLKDIPLDVIFRVAYAMLTIIAEGGVFYKIDSE